MMPDSPADPGQEMAGKQADRKAYVQSAHD
jgi:hypothetical protein